MKEQISYVKDNRFSINSNFQHCAIVCKTFHPMLLDRCLPCPVCNVGVLWPNSCMDQDATWYGGMYKLLAFFLIRWHIKIKFKV